MKNKEKESLGKNKKKKLRVKCKRSEGIHLEAQGFLEDSFV